MLKHYVKFFYPGAFVAETEVEEVKSRDAQKIKVPEGSYGFRFFDRQEITAENENHEPETLRGKPKNYSGMFYFGRIMTLDDVKREMPDATILISNMETNNWDKVVKTRMGNIQPFEEKDTIIEAQ